MFQVCTAIFAPHAEGRSGSIENPATPLSSACDDDGWGFGGGQTASGIRLNRRKALGYSAVWRATNLISNSLAKLPFRVFKSVGSGKSPDPMHPAYQLLRRKPNPYMTAIDFKRTLQHHALLRGNGYAYIYRDANAKPLELLPLNPDRVTPVRADGELWYVIEQHGKVGKGKLVKVPASDMLHIRGLGFDGLVGYDVISYCRESIGKAIAARDYSARFFANDARTSIALEFPTGMKDEIVDRIVNRWNTMHQGVDNKFRVGILREGIKLNQYSVNARDSQLLENLQFDANEIANVFGVPPHKVGGQKQGSYNSLFEENQAFFDDTIDPWAVTWEEQCDDKLLSEEEKSNDSHHCLFVRNALMRANPDVRSNYITRMVNNGLMNIDEGRAIEDMNPLPDGKGQIFYRPNAAVEANSLSVPKDPVPEPDPQNDTERSAKLIRSAVRPLVLDAARRMATRLRHQVERLKADELADYRTDDLPKNRDVIRDAFTPFLESFRLAGIALTADTIAGDVLRTASEEIARGIEPAVLVERIIALVDSLIPNEGDAK